MEEIKKRGRPKGSNDLVPRAKRTDMAKRSPDNFEAGDNNKFLSHALQISAMPVIDNTDPEQVSQRIGEYFQLCCDNDMKPTPAGLRNALRISKGTLSHWKNGIYREGTHQQIILEAYDLLDALWQDYMYNGKINPVAGIFIGKNAFNYRDQQEMVVTPNTTPEVEDIKTIEAKYAELPDIDD